MIDRSILKIASDTKNYGLKNKSSFKASGKNKLCGDKITIELDISAGKIKRMFYETESCLFCQASASLLSKVIKSVEINELIAEINSIKNIKKFKNTKYKSTNKRFVSFKKLLNIKYENRFNCVVLPLNTVIKAITP